MLRMSRDIWYFQSSFKARTKLETEAELTFPLWRPSQNPARTEAGWSLEVVGVASSSSSPWRCRSPNDSKTGRGRKSRRGAAAFRQSHAAETWTTFWSRSSAWRGDEKRIQTHDRRLRRRRFWLSSSRGYRKEITGWVGCGGSLPQVFFCWNQEKGGWVTSIYFQSRFWVLTAKRQRGDSKPRPQSWQTTKPTGLTKWQKLLSRSGTFYVWTQLTLFSVSQSTNLYHRFWQSWQISKKWLDSFLLLSFFLVRGFDSGFFSDEVWMMRMMGKKEIEESGKGWLKIEDGKKRSCQSGLCLAKERVGGRRCCRCCCCCQERAKRSLHRSLEAVGRKKPNKGGDAQIFWTTAATQRFLNCSRSSFGSVCSLVNEFTDHTFFPILYDASASWNQFFRL